MGLTSRLANHERRGGLLVEGREQLASWHTRWQPRQPQRAHAHAPSAIRMRVAGGKLEELGGFGRALLG